VLGFPWQWLYAPLGNTYLETLHLDSLLGQLVIRGMILTPRVGHLTLPKGKKSMGKILAPNNVSPRRSELNIVN